MTYWRSCPEINEPMSCPWCGKVTRKYYEEIRLPRDAPYEGNARVISRKRYNLERDTDVVRVTRDLWRAFDYGHFDTLRCAQSWANAVLDEEDAA